MVVVAYERIVILYANKTWVQDYPRTAKYTVIPHRLFTNISNL